MRTPVDGRTRGGWRRQTALVMAGAVLLAGVILLAGNLVSNDPHIAADGSSAPPPAAYVKFDGVDGESKDESHGNWIDVLSVNHSITRSGSSLSTGTAREASAPSIGEVVVTKTVDKATPKLQEAATNGTHFAEVVIDFASSSLAPGVPFTYFKYTMTDVIVTNYRISGSTAGDDRPTETLSLNFRKVKVTYTEQNADGSKGGELEFNWDIEANTAG